MLRRTDSRALPGKLQQMIHQGRRIGKPPGGYLSDLVSLRKVVSLCDSHAHKFDAARAHYFHEKNIPVDGRCDDCRQDLWARGSLFVPEELLGQTWTPRPNR